jgi:bifunctional UDP-N-acetylglucosamine pyrophosphorylase/glucosamine-1-phosphate N-acetyltransferase
MYVVDALKAAGIDDICLVVGHGKEYVQKLFDGDRIRFVVQEEQRGTGHALMQAEKAVDPASAVIVLAGDTPLLRASTIKNLRDFHENSQAAASVLSCKISKPRGYGRIIRNADSSFARIVEEKDAGEREKAINEINSGIYCFQAKEVFRALAQINTANAQGEYYLTDVLEIMKNEDKKVGILIAEVEEDIYGINDRIQLSQAESIIRKRKNTALMKNGVTIIDPSTTFIDRDVRIGRDTIILPFTMIEGNTIIGERCEIGPSSRINDSVIASDVSIESSRVKEARIADKCVIGPYSYLRPGAVLQQGVKVGDFVEIKKSTIGEDSKVPHLTYVGDAQVGRGVNIGAGTITCNYDGKNKYETILEDGAFIGSNTNLVAPVKIGKNAVTGAGSTISRDVPANSLGVERAKQKNLSRRNNTVE